MERATEDGSSSVGQALKKNVAFTISHPLYVGLSEAMERKVAELSSARGFMKAASSVSVVTLALGTDDMATLGELYPEFRMSVFAFSKPAHAMLVQFRRFGAEWLLMQAKKLASRVVVLGTPTVSMIDAGFESLLVVMDPGSPVAVHERHSVAVDAYRLYSNYIEVSEQLGTSFPRSRYDDFLRGKGMRVVTDFSADVKGDVLCVDGWLNAYNPWQVATAMLTTGASVAMGFVPYHPVMLLNEEGELPGFDVWFSRDEASVRFRYPDGIAGTTVYTAEAWRSWLTGHGFVIGVDEKHVFQLELLKHRGCALFYRMVKLEGADPASEVVHALDLPSSQPMYVVSSMRLKSLGSDPSRPESWTVSDYLVGQRLVDRVYQFAMQLPREQFTRYAIRKQLHIVNDRVTIEGTSVRVNSALGERMVDALVVDLFARVFVDRYEAGTLVDAVKRYVDSYSQFATASRLGRLWFVATTLTMSAWEVTLSPVNRYVRSVADTVRSWLSSSVQLGVPRIRVAPSYLLVSGKVRGLELSGGALAAGELDRRAALGSAGLLSELVRTIAQLQGPARLLEGVAMRVESYALFGTVSATGPEVDDVVSMMRTLNPVDEAPYYRRSIEAVQVTRRMSSELPMDFTPVADPVYTLNEFYSTVLPGVAEQNLEYDTASVSLDPQDRVLTAPYLKLPKYFGDAPRPKAYYKSRLRALNVPKRQQTLQELLSAIAARNLNAPQVALPQNDSVTARVVWENFLSVACVEDARGKLRAYRRDPVGLEEEAFREWTTQSNPQKLSAVRRELEEHSKALAEMDVQDYLVMLKADAKPTMSRKPLDQRTEPQVIVYHEKALSALYSCIFRVLVRRFLSLLKPNYHVNLLKDTRDMEGFVRGVHPFGVGGLKYLENDFSKYDKSQGKFVFVLEELVFQELGMDMEFLRQWLGGHVECSLRAVSLGLSLHVLYQRKSGDATTSFGNVLLNVLSVSYAYRGTEVVWALFMGDDSLVCARAVAHEDDAVAILAEVFNLGAKTYMTDAPYFASSFVLIDGLSRVVHFVPDPVKRIERWSMAVSADDPQWHERYVSACDAMQSYLNCSKTVLLPKVVAERYDVSAAVVVGTADAMATVLAKESMFRAMWEAEPTQSNY